MNDKQKEKPIRLLHPKTKTRFTTLRRDQGYGIGRTSLIKRWKIMSPNIKGILNINGIEVNFPWMDGVEFDIVKIRKELSEIIPLTGEENSLFVIDSTLYDAQLTATEYYNYFPSKCLFDYIFTGGLCVCFYIISSSSDKIPDVIDVEEEYVLSEYQTHICDENENI